jgi:hypothetical protein
MALDRRPARDVVEGLHEALLLDKAQKLVDERAPDVHRRIRQLVTAVDARISAADALAAGEQLTAALVVLRDAAKLAAQALLESKGLKEALLPAETPLECVARNLTTGAKATPPEGFANTCALLGNSNPLVFDELSRQQALVRRAEVAATVTWLREQVESRTLAEIKLSRALRLALVGLAIFACAAGLVTWVFSKVSTGKNLARGKPAQTSSRRPYCPGTSGELGLAPSGLVDDATSGMFDICTKTEVSPWAMVDLGEVHALSKAEVYNRNDCCWGQYDLPQVLEISLDGTTFTEVARQTTVYTGSDPWKAALGGRPARFIRVRVDAKEPRELVLTELQVFGR